MGKIQALLHISAKLYQYLEKVPVGGERDSFIEQLDTYLDERGLLIDEMRAEGFIVNHADKSHMTLIELDKGIKERLNNAMAAVKADLKDLQNAKKNEQQYMNPYTHLQTMDGMYYDKKK